MSESSFVLRSFLAGFARVFDLGGQLDPIEVEKSGPEADARALYSDWVAIGGDFRRAEEKLLRQIESQDPDASRS